MDFICGLNFLFYLGIHIDGKFIVPYPRLTPTTTNAYVEALTPVCWYLEVEP